MSELTFNELNIVPNILKVLEEMKFSIPTEIQERAIPVLLESNKHFIGQAQTGTGKTAAFVIPLLQKIDIEAFMRESGKGKQSIKMYGKNYQHKIDYDHINILTAPEAIDETFADTLAWLRRYT